MKITLPCFGIVIKLAGKGGTIISQLHNHKDSLKVRVAMDAIEAVILAHACAGVDVASPAYVEGIETAVETYWNKLG